MGIETRAKIPKNTTVYSLQCKDRKITSNCIKNLHTKFQLQEFFNPVISEWLQLHNNKFILLYSINET